MGAYYNENDPFAAAWLRELIKAGLIAPGEVDERSIEEVKPDDLRGFTQCHFFAGIGVWSYALRAAGWADDSPVWTGSCPCQGFSASGQRGGFSDKRHLWPAWFRLIRECRPVTVFGEQVASKDGLAWLDVVSADMEAESYAIGATDICAAGFGAPHIRQRLYFVADSLPARRAERWPIAGDRSLAGRCGAGNGEYPTALGLSQRASEKTPEPEREPSRETQQRSGDARNGSDSDGGNASTERLQRSGEHGLRAEDRELGNGGNATINGDGAFDRQSGESPQSQKQTGRSGPSIDSKHSDRSGPFARQQTSEGMGHGSTTEPTGGAFDSLNTEQQGLEGHTGDVREWRGPGWLDPITARSVAAAGATRGYWGDCDWWYGRDGKYRPIGAGLFPLVAGATGRMGKLRGYGNAICAPQAQAFIEAYMSLG